MEVKETVREKYGQAALRVSVGGSSCCGAAAALDGCCDPITSNLYDASQTSELPDAGFRVGLFTVFPLLSEESCPFTVMPAGTWLARNPNAAGVTALRLAMPNGLVAAKVVYPQPLRCRGTVWTRRFLIEEKDVRLYASGIKYTCRQAQERVDIASIE